MERLEVYYEPLDNTYRSSKTHKPVEFNILVKGKRNILTNADKTAYIVYQGDRFHDIDDTAFKWSSNDLQ